MMTESTSYQGPERRWPPRYLAVGQVEIPFVEREKALQTVDRSFHDRVQICVGFVNANTLFKALNHHDYANLLNEFLILNDGVGVDICSLILSGRRFEANLNGTDFIPDLLNYGRYSLNIFLLGGKPETAQRAGKKLTEQFPQHCIVGTQHGYFKDDEISAILETINQSKADLLLVGLGNPQQEEFIARYRRDLKVPVLAGVGAFLDFAAGNVVRAPHIVRTLRLEWLFRLAQEPRRLGSRYTRDLICFLAQILRLKLKTSAGESIVEASPNERRLRKTCL